MTSITSLQAITLDLPPSCIEFWPLNPQYAIVGTYNLEKPEERTVDTESERKTDENSSQKRRQERNGSLIIVRISGDDVRIIQTIPTPSAVLDIHFAPTYLSPSIFGVATSTGDLVIYQLIDSNGDACDSIGTIADIPKAVILQTISTSPDVLVTAFSWHSTEPAVGLTLSSGTVSFARVDIENLSLIRDVGQHSLEAWTCAFMPDGMGLLSGGDDSGLSLWELPTASITSSAEEGDDAESALPSDARWTDMRIHGAGVTAILPIKSDEQETLILTGSYDDHIRLIQVPTIGRRKVLAEMYLGGGVWRLKSLGMVPSPEKSKNSSAPIDLILLASCMHAGARVMKLIRKGEDDWAFEVLAKFEEHKSMNYGSDCQAGVNEAGQRTFITTSFYDRLLCLWRY